MFRTFSSIALMCSFENYKNLETYPYHADAFLGYGKFFLID